MLHDVTIVGAGPSGSYLAYLLAKEGLSVALLEKDRFPREKACGGGVSKKTMGIIEFDISPVVQRSITGAFLTFQNRDTVVKDLGEPGGVTVLRSEFDAFLLDRARERGVVFHDSCAFDRADRRGDVLEVRTSRSTIRSRYLIGADGVYSRVRNTLFGKKLVTYAPAFEALVDVSPDVRERFAGRVLFDFGGMKGGYGWIFPKRDHLNVGVFSVFRNGTISEELYRFISGYRCLEGARVIKEAGHAIPLRNVEKVYQKENVWLVGDAAGFAESLYGEGIYFSLRSALAASRAMIASFGNIRSRLYSETIEREMASELHYSRLSARAIFSFQKFCFYRLVRNRGVNDTFARLIAGGVTHKQAFFRTLLNAPLWFWPGRTLPATPGGF